MAAAERGGAAELEWYPPCSVRGCDENFEPVDVIYACPDCGCLSAEVLAARSWS